MRRVFRDWPVLLVSPQLTQNSYLEMLEPFGFRSIETTSDDQQVIGLIKKRKPGLVVAAASLPVFSGAQLLSAVRNDDAARDTPFIVIGVKEDARPGGLAEKIEKTDLARFISVPVSKDKFAELVLSFLDNLIDPEQEEAYGLFDKAKDLAGAGDLIEAAENYEKGLDLYDRNLDAWVKFAGVLAELEAYDESERAYIKALSINRLSLEAYIGMADLYERRQDYEQTVSVLKQALGIARTMKAPRKSMSRLNFFIGEFELRLERLAGAEESFSRAIENDPGDASLRIDIGDAYAEKGYFAESEQHYETALQIDPNLAHIFNRLGIAYRRQHKYEKAIQLYDNALFYHPEDEHLLFNIARAHFEDIRHDEALAVLDKALGIAPGFKEAKRLSARLKGALKRTEITG